MLGRLRFLRGEFDGTGHKVWIERCTMVMSTRLMTEGQTEMEEKTLE